MVLASKFRLVLLMVGVLCFVALLVAGLNSQTSEAGAIPVVRQFPSMAVEQLEPAREVNSLQLFDAPYQLVNVWASWCSVCRQEHAFLIQLAQNNVPIIGLNYRDRASSARQYLAKLGTPYHRTLFDPDGRLALDLGVVGTPETYLVSQSGQIVYKHLGVMNETVWQKHFARYFSLGEKR
ncbi:DsbE family thiol:disulfide interchange protein [Vibrio sinaloensis]|uniref:DsbE family thiol:disulfide interchange protein n=1 Tax=Photobacterium sp. (strain ATCC 43367) TaxID=379097 RepID=UPI002065A81B|nr:DsbE family thiol:disulfide interchange protein [Vibrio sinaloensis]UPQ87264.1 DsbE family thiol:disulfide interchange protein [Vibrio sinaloensis]